MTECTTWSGGSSPITSITTAWSGNAQAPSGINTAWTGPTPIEPIFPIPSCEILGPPHGPYLSSCEMVEGNSAAQGAVEACLVGSGATYWDRTSQPDTTWSGTTFSATPWTDNQLVCS